MLKELKSLNLPEGTGEPTKVVGRKIIEIKGPESTLWHLMHKSRIAEDI